MVNARLQRVKARKLVYNQSMDTIIAEILDLLRAGELIDADRLSRIILRAIRRDHAERHAYSKRRLWPFYLEVKQHNPHLWQTWNVTPELEAQLRLTLRMKPRRTASGVATVSVLTKPWPCSSNCMYCPNDLRMPKSYLSREPACARAERVWFDPYLQVSARLTALSQMGHPTDKIELIVLGGTWSDYAPSYQRWFVHELFRALNDFNAEKPAMDEPLWQEREALYEQLKLPREIDDLAAFVADEQQRIEEGASTYNQSWRRLYAHHPAWEKLSKMQDATLDELHNQQRLNEGGAHRCVGLVFETRPDAVTPANLTFMRDLGATKVQMGIQALDNDVLGTNHRHAQLDSIKRAFALMRLYGFKIHTHTMLNLMGSTPERDRQDYERMFTDRAFCPDEVKIYPTALVSGTDLCAHYQDHTWVPYSPQDLEDTLVADVLATPAYCRISRMIRDISAEDIVAGNKRANLRQDVDSRAAQAPATPIEIRTREIGNTTIDIETLSLDDVVYDTHVSCEHFLQWIDPQNRIAGFCRLSLPKWNELAGYEGARELFEQLPVRLGDAMIREVHVYGNVSKLNQTGTGAQHHGLGRKLVARACEIAHEGGYDGLNVISAVGTRNYYRAQGFEDADLYLRKQL